MGCYEKSTNLDKEISKALATSSKVNYDPGNETIYIQALNSDGAGSYFVIWKVEKGIYRDRFIAYGF